MNSIAAGLASALHIAIALLLVAHAIGPSVSLSQDHTESGVTCKTLQESELGILIGDWEVEWHYRVAPGQWNVSTASSAITLDMAGCIWTEQFSGDLQGKPFMRLTSIARLTETEYDRVVVDTEHGAFTQSSGVHEGDSLTFHWQRDLGNRVLRTMHSFVIGPSTFEVHFYMSPREGAPWQVVNKAYYRRLTD